MGAKCIEWVADSIASLEACNSMPRQLSTSVVTAMLL